MSAQQWDNLDNLFEALFGSQVRSENVNGTFTLDVPGYSKKDLDIEATNGVLSITGTSATRGKFTKHYRISQKLDTTQISATLLNGVLTLTLPEKKDSSSHKVEIKG